jgi:hypothetical protein
VNMQSTPGCYAQYGPAEVITWARDEDEATTKAYIDLKRSAFPDRTRDMWRVLGVREVRD